MNTIQGMERWSEHYVFRSRQQLSTLSRHLGPNDTISYQWAFARGHKRHLKYWALFPGRQWFGDPPRLNESRNAAPQPPQQPRHFRAFIEWRNWDRVAFGGSTWRKFNKNNRQVLWKNSDNFNNQKSSPADFAARLPHSILAASRYNACRTTQKFILLLAGIWKIDEESSSTKPKKFAYNGCVRQFAKKSPLVVATLTPSAR